MHSNLIPSFLTGLFSSDFELDILFTILITFACATGFLQLFYTIY